LDVSPDPAGGRITCPSCQAVFTVWPEPDDPPRAEPPEETGVTSDRRVRVGPVVPPRPLATGRPGADRPKAAAGSWPLAGIALLPLVVPAVAIPLGLLVGGIAGAALWGAVGAGLAGAGLLIARRGNWSRPARVSLVLGLAGLSFVILLGALAADFYLGPEVVRPLPTVVVEASYPGANAQVVADTLAAPIEQQVNGVEGMTSMSSQCTNDGNYTLTVTFRPGCDLNIAQVLVMNRESLAEPILPDLVKHNGVTVMKRSPGAAMILNVFSPDRSLDSVYLSNYATLQVRDELARVPGVGDVTSVGQRDPVVRAWLDADKLTTHELTARAVIRALEQQNIRVVAGRGINEPLTLIAPRRPPIAEEFEKIVVEADPVGRTCLGQVARVEIGGGPPPGEVLLDGKPAVALVVHPIPHARLSELRPALRETLARLRERLPVGIDLDTGYDFTANLAAGKWQATPGYLLLDVDLPPDASPERRLKAAERCAAVVREVAGVQGALVMTEHPFDRPRDRACVLVRPGPDADKPAGRAEFLRNVRTLLGEVKEAKVRLRDLSGPGRFWDCRYPVELVAYGPEADRVREFAGKLAGRLRQDQDLTDVWAGSDTPPRRELTAAVERYNGYPMAAVTANPAPGVSLARARALCEGRAEEVRKELGLSAEYRLAWR
jgi:multidrug efflux pump subunit AcrB